jgi:uncharacterized membrane protein
MQGYSSLRKRTLNLIITSMLIALVFVATVLLNFRLPIAANGGLVHMGTVILFVVCILCAQMLPGPFVFIHEKTDSPRRVCL